MNIIEAFKAARDGKKIRLSLWGNATYLKMGPEDMHPYSNGGSIYRVDAEDILSNDWEIIEEKKATMPLTKEDQELILHSLLAMSRITSSPLKATCIALHDKLKAHFEGE